MKTLTLTSVFIFAIAVVAFAGDNIHKHGANVYKVDSDGTHHAVCGCGHKIEVGETTEKVEFEDQTYYLCGTKCKDHFEKSAADLKDAFKDLVTKAQAEEGLLGNVYKVDDKGNKVAKCACGMDVKVGENTLSRTHKENTYYLCGEHCATAFDKNPSKVIKGAEIKIKSTKKDDA